MEAYGSLTAAAIGAEMVVDVLCWVTMPLSPVIWVPMAQWWMCWVTMLLAPAIWVPMAQWWVHN